MGGVWRAAALATEFGFSVAGPLVGGVLAGRYLDQQLGTTPAFLLMGIFAGFVFSIYLIYVIYRIQIQPRRVGPSPSMPRTSPNTPAGNRSEEQS
jgi:F0F1-type ATP synthase assembly protein I